MSNNQKASVEQRIVDHLKSDTIGLLVDEDTLAASYRPAVGAGRR